MVQECKPIEVRIKEAVNINKQIRSFGGFLEECNAGKLREANNKWIKHGESCGCKLYVGETTLRITFSNKKQSGIVLEK